MNALSKEEVINIIQKMKYPEVVQGIIKGDIPTLLKNYFSTPMVFDLTLLEQEQYGFGKILPLWSDANGDIVYAYDLSKEDYFCFNWEGNIKARYDNWDGLLEANIKRVMDVVWDEQTEGEVVLSLNEVFVYFDVSDVNLVLCKIINKN